jgi:hypothetical protein
VHGLGVCVRVDSIQRLPPGRQRLMGAGIHPSFRVSVPDGRPVGCVVLDVDRGPPDLVVSGRCDLPQHSSGDGPADGEVGVRGESPLWLDRSGVLNAPAHTAAKVLPETVQ